MTALRAPDHNETLQLPAVLGLLSQARDLLETGQSIDPGSFFHRMFTEATREIPGPDHAQIGEAA